MYYGAKFDSKSATESLKTNFDVTPPHDVQKQNNSNLICSCLILYSFFVIITEKSFVSLFKNNFSSGETENGLNRLLSATNNSFRHVRNKFLFKAEIMRNCLSTNISFTTNNSKQIYFLKPPTNKLIPTRNLVAIHVGR